MNTRAKAEFDVAVTHAEGLHTVALEKCEVLDGVEEESCVSTADATFAANEAAAIATRDNALVRADQHQ